ncbi:MAG: MarR family winged helix-turn-helix transcriptional regulator [Ferrimicrobium sp.]
MAENTSARAANLLGALVLTIGDRLDETLVATVGHSQSAAAMLSALEQFLEAPGVEGLSEVLGLSQSGTVRLVDRLERDGYVRRGPGADARSVTVILTSAGRRAAQRAREQRMALLMGLLDPLDESERHSFAETIGRVLVGMMREPGAVRWTCRLCDLGACKRADGQCPLEQEARRRYG